MYKAHVKVLPADASYICGRLYCDLKATFLSNELYADGGDGPEFAYCDLHYSEYASNGALHILSVQDPHNRLVR